MTAAPLRFRDERLMLDPTGAAFWPGKRVLIAADPPFVTSGFGVPPADSRGALERLNRLIRLYRPQKSSCSAMAASPAPRGCIRTSWRG